MQKNILITGQPRSGKSTLLNKVISNIEPKKGFVTNEIREEGERVGFEIETSTGNKATLAHVNFNTEYKVSRYFVDINNLENILPEVNDFNNELLYIDEIGQMELFSNKFEELVLKYLDSNNTCVSTFSCVFENDFMKKIKEREDIILIEITQENREEKYLFISQLLSKIEKAKKYISTPDIFTIYGSLVEVNSDHGPRKLNFIDNKWQCDCDFFKQNNICSHTIAVNEVVKL